MAAAKSTMASKSGCCLRYRILNCLRLVPGASGLSGWLWCVRKVQQRFCEKEAAMSLVDGPREIHNPSFLRGAWGGGGNHSGWCALYPLCLPEMK